MNREWVYKCRIISKEANETILVKAKSAPAARRHASLKHIEVVEATFQDINEFGQKGIPIEEAAT